MTRGHRLIICVNGDELSCLPYLNTQTMKAYHFEKESLHPGSYLFFSHYYCFLSTSSVYLKCWTLVCKLDEKTCWYWAPSMKLGMMLKNVFSLHTTCKQHYVYLKAIGRTEHEDPHQSNVQSLQWYVHGTQLATRLHWIVLRAKLECVHCLQYGTQ